MTFCSNNINTSCLNGGQCVSNSCLCSSACYSGNYCETYYNAIDLPFSSAMLEDTLIARIIYIISITSFVAIGLINNIAGLMTFTRESIRITACGIYLIVFSICTILLMIFLQISVLTVAEYDTPSFRLWSCYASPYMSLTMGYTGIWISLGIAVERVLIECFNMSLYGTRRHATFLSIGVFIYSAGSNLPAVFARKYAPDPGGKWICVYDYITSPAWKQVDTIFSYIHVIVPCAGHLICTACILTTIARRKILIHRNNHPDQRLCCVWLRQLYIHRDFLVPPTFLIVCLLPNVIHGHLIVKCAPYSSFEDLRLHIVFIFLLHVPSVFVYVVYIYPNDLYRKEFRQTCFYRILCNCFYRRHQRHTSSRQYQVPLTTKSNISSEFIEDSHL